jgi:hypothetical protein
MVSGKRAANLTGNIAVFVTKTEKKDTYSKVAELDLFYGDKRKFKVYYT